MLRDRLQRLMTMAARFSARRGTVPGQGPAPVQPPGPAGTGQFLAAAYAGPAGSRPYRLYIPSVRKTPAPLLVMLHGCTQTPEDFAAGTRMNAHADRSGFLVLYPSQIASANAQRCWNWFSAADQVRGHGEPAIIAAMAHAVAQAHAINPQSVYAAGLSAGGAQAAILGALYPDIFAGIGVHSGLAFGAAGDVRTALAAMRSGAAGQGQFQTPAIIFQGDADRTVSPVNAASVAAQFGAAGAGRLEQGRAPGGQAFTRTIFRSGRVEQWMVHGLGHAWSGGSADGSFTDPAGPDASIEMLRFFGLAA